MEDRGVSTVRFFLTWFLRGLAISLVTFMCLLGIRVLSAISQTRGNGSAVATGVFEMSVWVVPAALLIAAIATTARALRARSY